MKDDTFYEGSFFFDPDDSIYADHFPGHPVVPGSLIVHAFLTAAAGLAGVPATKTVRNFRFKRFIVPGRYLYRIQNKKDGLLACTLFDGQAAVVTGSINTKVLSVKF